MGEMTETDIDAMRTALAVVREDLFGDPEKADQVASLFTSWEHRAGGFEALCGAILRVMHNNGIAVETLLDDLALFVAGE